MKNIFKNLLKGCKEDEAETLPAHAYDINLYKVCVFILIASNELSVRCATGSHQFTTLLSILIRFSKEKQKKKKKKTKKKKKKKTLSSDCTC